MEEISDLDNPLSQSPIAPSLTHPLTHTLTHTHSHTPYHPLMSYVQQHLMEEISDLQRQLKEATDLAKLTETVTTLALPQPPRSAPFISPTLCPSYIILTHSLAKLTRSVPHISSSLTL